MILDLGTLMRTRCPRSLRLILNQRPHVVPFQFLSSGKEFQLHNKNQSLDFSAEAFDQIANSPSSSAGGQQIIRNDYAMPVADCVAMNLKRVLPVFEIVRDRRPFSGQLL